MSSLSAEEITAAVREGIAQSLQEAQQAQDPPVHHLCDAAECPHCTETYAAARQQGAAETKDWYEGIPAVPIIRERYQQAQAKLRITDGEEDKEGES